MAGIERRQRPERRAVPRWTEWRWILGGRRRQARRAGDARAFRPDSYPASLLGATVTILTLSVLDGWVTLQLLALDLATEANPVMASLIDEGVTEFVAFKSALTGCCILLLVLYSQVPVVGRFTVSHGLHAAASLYLALIGYELALLGNWFP